METLQVVSSNANISESRKWLQREVKTLINKADEIFMEQNYEVPYEVSIRFISKKKIKLNTSK